MDSLEKPGDVFMLEIPEWVKKIKNDEIASGIVGLMFEWAYDGEEKYIPNLREYVAKVYDDISEEEVEEICRLLIEHKVVKSDNEKGEK